MIQGHGRPEGLRAKLRDEGVRWARQRKMGTLMLILLCGMLVSLGHGSPVRAATPQEDLKKGIDAIVALLTDPELAREERRVERRARIYTEVKARFDFRHMSELTLAREWENHSGQEREQFVEVFSSLILERYISRIESYSNEAVLYKKEIVRDDKARVYTGVVKSEQEIPITYSLEKQAGGWMVYDVTIEGVSLVRNYRSEFEVILKNENFAGLIARIQEKIKQMQH